jgi:hypothetical protein
MSGGEFVEQALREAHGQGSGSAGELDLNALARECKRIADEHGFKDASVPEDVALIHSEASELLEDFREGKIPHEMHYVEKVQAFTQDGSPLTGDDGVPVFVEVPRRDAVGANGKLRKPVGIPSEVADIVIRCLHFSGKHGIDLHGAVVEKMTYNDSRTFMHGGKKI